jgi:anti-anti-sigma factor
VSVHSLLSLTSPSTSARCKVDLVTGQLTLRGDLDQRLQPQLAACVTALTAARPRVWLVDLQGVAFCDVPSLRVFVALERAARRRSAALLLAGASPALRDLLGLVGLGPFLVDVPEPGEPATAGLSDAERAR